MQYFVFCQSDLVLEKVGDSYQIPTEQPVEVKPWTTVMDIDGAKAYRIDTPIAAHPSGTSNAVSNHKLQTSNIKLQKTYEMCPLRQSYYKLPEADYLKAGKCHELLYWDQNTKFCGVCGGPMRFDTAISKKCEHCGKEVWPQLAIAIIVLVRRRVTDSSGAARDEVLLVHANSFRDDHYGLVAGFVETGETLEEAVHREVMEETGLHITNLRYFGSQPWPYPCGLMVGYTADYDHGKIHLQRSELSKGSWFDRDHLPHIPEKLSIARHLIDAWLEEVK